MSILEKKRKKKEERIDLTVDRDLCKWDFWIWKEKKSKSLSVESCLELSSFNMIHRMCLVRLTQKKEWKKRKNGMEGKISRKEISKEKERIFGKAGPDIW